MALRSEPEELRSAWKSLSGNADGEGWRAISIGSSRCRAGVRSPGNEEALLVGFNLTATRAANLPQGRGFSVVRVGDAPSGGFDLWLAVSRKSAASLELFTLMAADVLAAVNSVSGDDELRPYQQFHARIRSWQQFMERPRDRRLSDDEEVGLIGELTVFQYLLRAGIFAQTVADSWKGPANGLRDFVVDAMDIEVKATTSTNGFPARISSLEQLDDVSGRTVCLTALRFSVQDGGQTLPEVIDSVRNRIGDNGRVSFERNLLLAGYEDAHAPEYLRGFILVGERNFLISEEFPRLTRSAVPIAIRSADYEIDLDLIEAESVDFDYLISGLGALPAL